MRRSRSIASSTTATGREAARSWSIDQPRQIPLRGPRQARRHVLYSRGFASIYGEWETTGEQKTAHRTFHESLRLPWPREPVTVTLSEAPGRQQLRADMDD